MPFVLDTNVVSELINAAPEPRVIDWLDRQAEDELLTTVVTVHEMRYGVERREPGRRRRELEREIAHLFEVAFAGRVLELGRSAAEASGRIQAARERIGRPISLGDCLIAGIAVASSATVVTRDAEDFASTGIRVINPWD